MLLENTVRAAVRCLYGTRTIKEKTRLPEQLRSRTLRAMLKVFGREPSTYRNPYPLLGYQVSFLGAPQFRNLFKEVFVEGLYYFDSPRPDPVIIDCGSNIGFSILYFKLLYPAARITGFEPDPDIFAILQKNVTQNRLTDVAVHPFALSDTEGTAEFFRPVNQPGSLRGSMHEEIGHGEKMTVTTRRLAPFITGPVDLLKLDVEGAEGAILRDLLASGKLALVRNVHMEYHHHMMPASDNLSAMLRMFEEQGFGYQLLQLGETDWPTPLAFQGIHAFFYRKDDRLRREGLAAAHVLDPTMAPPLVTPPLVKPAGVTQAAAVQAAPQPAEP